MVPTLAGKTILENCLKGNVDEEVCRDKNHTHCIVNFSQNMNDGGDNLKFSFSTKNDEIL